MATVLISVLLSLMILFRFIHGGAGDVSAYPAEREPWVALVLQYANSDYNRRLVEGIQEGADQLGLRMEIHDAQHNNRVMVEMLNDVILRKADGILISHGSPELLEKAVQRRIDNGIPFVAIHCDLRLPGVTLIGQDDRKIADMIIREMISDSKGNADFVLIWIDGYDPMIKRMEVYETLMAQHPGMVERERFGAASSNTSLHTRITMSEILSRYPEHSLDAVLATWDEYAKGASEAILNEGRTEIKVYGIDISDTVLAMLRDRDNPWVATVGVDSKELGKLQFRLIASAIEGKSLSRRYSLQPVLIRQDMLPEDVEVTMENLSRFVDFPFDYSETGD